MIVVMKAHSSNEEVQHVLTFLHNHGLSGHLSQGVERTVIGVLGQTSTDGAPSGIGNITPGLEDSLGALLV
ncbi:hypothetical protein [Ktedonospora formicarum]|uniref:DAHP synthase ferredoxin-like domain-containing protein n=1 Tax=Ktedonospora formicarum TaxID=2778364 RepID=A0A8J3MTG0_9CHLR|nr:hypothetical protein [Ktedonospora formicarum]GHO45553.1 hypothetical protein KSX_37160 [Ktedonospora formicarum]